MRYPVHTLISSTPASTSSIVRHTPVAPLIITEYFTATRSSHPTRRGRPVVVPNSRPRFRIPSPISFFSSVGNGPAPTRVEYAFIPPSTRPTRVFGTPVPGPIPDAMHVDPVTYGYVP